MADASRPFSEPGSGVIRVRASDSTNLDSVVSDLNSLSKAATMQFALTVGELIIQRLYSGQIGRFRSRERKHNVALRAVAAHPDLAMSASMLYGCVAIYELCERFGIRSWKHVSTSHLRLVLPLAPEDQERLLREAEAKRWPVKLLEEHIAATAKSHGSPPGRGGRKPRSMFRRTIHLFEKDLANVSCCFPEDSSAEPSPESARAAVDLLRRVADVCVNLESRLAPIAARASEEVLPATVSIVEESRRPAGE
jgi:hypothetical protein